MPDKIFTFEELASHNKADDLWMAIDGKVYDCTAFLDEHPGGEEVLVDCGGMDATGPFDDIGHSDDAREALKSMLVGKLDMTSVPSKSSGGAGASATTGGEDNVGLIIAIVVILLAIVAYLVLHN